MYQSNPQPKVLNEQIRICKETINFKVFQLMFSGCEDEQIDSKIKSVLSEFKIEEFICLYKVIRRLNFWSEFFMTRDSHNIFSETCNLLDVTDKTTIQQSFKEYRENIIEQLIKLTKKDMKSYLLVTLSLIQSEQEYSTLDIIDLLYQMYLIPDELLIYFSENF